MRIALLCSDPLVDLGDGRGCSIRLRSLADGLLRAGHTVAAIVAGAGEAHQGTLPPGLEIRPLRLPATLREIDWHFSRIQPDLVIERLTPGDAAGAQAAAEAGLPHVYDLASAHEAGGAEGLDEPLRWTGGVLVGSKSVADWIATLAPVPTFVLPGAASAECLRSVPSAAVRRIEQRLRLGSDEFRVGFIGALTPESGVLELVEAVGALARTRPARLVIIGDGPQRNPILRASFEHATPLVLCGRVPHEDVPAHLSACQAIALPGDRGDAQRAPLALYEAMATARAVVAAETPANRAVVQHERDALLVAPRDVDALREALLRLSSENGLCERLGGSARSTVEREHTWDALAARALRFARDITPRDAASVQGTLSRLSAR